MKSARPHRVVGAGAFSAAVIVLLGLLWLLASSLTRHELRRSAEAEFSAWSAGTSPWRWHLLKADDVTGDRAFGHATLRPVTGGLQAASLDGSAYEIGLPMPRDADVTATPLLRANLTATATTSLWLVQRQSPTAALCLASVTANSGHPTTWILPTLNWQASGGRPCPAPRRLSMLRLRVQQPEGSNITIGALALLPRHVPRAQSASDAIILPMAIAAARKVLANASGKPVADSLPRVIVPARGSPGQLLALRDLAHAKLPTALVTADARPLVAASLTHGSPTDSMPRWLGVGIYALVLLGIARYPRRNRLRVAWELAGCLAGPLWLMAGLNLGMHAAAVDLAPFVLGLVFALLIQWRERPMDWRWGGKPSAWWMPLALLPVALLLALLLARHPMQWPAPHHVMVYLLWATVQQWLMLTFVLTRLRVLLPGAVAIVACAVLFALSHTPNAHLMQLCLLAELWWAWCFVRSRAVLPIALAHAACALLLQATLPGGWLRSLEVSARFFSG